MEELDEKITLSELFKKLKLSKKTYMIGEYNPTGIYPDFADEMLETHGNKLVTSFYNSKVKKTLVVTFA